MFIDFLLQIDFNDLKEFIVFLLQLLGLFPLSFEMFF